MSMINTKLGTRNEGFRPHADFSPRLDLRGYRQSSPGYDYYDGDSISSYYSSKATRLPRYSEENITSRDRDSLPREFQREEEPVRRHPNSATHLASRFADNTSLQGVVFIKNSTRWYSKTFWIVIFLLAMCATFYQTFNVFKKYYSYQTTTSVGIGYDKLPFPSVVICNINPIRKSKVNEYGDDLIEFIDKINPSSSYKNEWDHDWNMSESWQRKKRSVDCDPARLDCATIAPPDKPQQAPPAEGTEPPIAVLTPTPLPSSTTTSTGSTTKVSQKSEAMMQCKSGDPRCSFLKSPCQDDDAACKAKYPTLYSKSNLTSKYEKYNSEFDDSENESNYDYGKGDVSYTLQLREEFKDIMSHFSRDERADLGHQVETMILTCSFNGRKCYYWDTVQHITGDYGNCYTFNSAFMREKPLRARKSGTPYGLSLMLYIEGHEYIPGLTQGRGMRVVIHPFNTMPFVVENGLSVKPGEETYIGVRMLNMTRKGEPYGKCGDDGEFKKSFGYTYTVEACINTCLARAVLAKCGCYMDTQPELYNPSWALKSKPCERDDQMKCLYKLRFRFEQGKLNCKCHQACNALEYDVEMSHNTWPDSSFWYALVDAVCERNEQACQYLIRAGEGSEEHRRKLLQENFLYLHMYYRDLNFEKIEEKPDYESEQFLSDFGGTMGLWVGASFITGIEFVYFVSQLCLHCLRRGCV